MFLFTFQPVLVLRPHTLTVSLDKSKEIILNPITRKLNGTRLDLACPLPARYVLHCKAVTLSPSLSVSPSISLCLSHINTAATVIFHPPFAITVCRQRRHRRRRRRHRRHQGRTNGQFHSDADIGAEQQAGNREDSRCGAGIISNISSRIWHGSSLTRICRNIALGWEGDGDAKRVSHCTPSHIIRLGFSPPTRLRLLRLRLSASTPFARWCRSSTFQRVSPSASLSPAPAPSALRRGAISVFFHLPLYHFPIECISVRHLHTILLRSSAATKVAHFCRI